MADSVLWVATCLIAAATCAMLGCFSTIGRIFFLSLAEGGTDET